MIEYNMNADGNLILQQVIHPPLLYFDTWMWCDLSTNDDLRDRFVSIARKKNPTMMYSVATLIELACISNQKQINVITDLMNEFDYGISDIDPRQVINREKNNRPLAVDWRVSANDVQFINTYFFEIADPLKPIRVSDILTRMKQEAKPLTYKLMTQRFAPLNKIIAKGRQDPKALNRVRKRWQSKKLKGQQRPYTADIFNLVTLAITVNLNMKMDSKRWMDLMHMVVPLSYHDFILLDNTWCTFIRQNIPLKYPDIAQVFSPNEMYEFLDALANFKQT